MMSNEPNKSERTSLPRQRPSESEELDKAIRDLWDQGVQARRKIARTLGVSLGTVCGRVYRMGLRNPPKPPADRAEETDPSSSRSAARLSPTSQPRRPSQPNPAFKTCQHLDGVRGHYSYCNLPTERGSYCGAHGSIYYRGLPT